MSQQERTKTNKKAMLSALEKSLGIVTSACAKVGISRVTHYIWLKEDEEYRKSVEDVENIALDFAESQLHKQIGEGSTQATTFYLSRKGKGRGYVERQEIQQETTHKNLEVKIISTGIPFASEEGDIID